MEFTHRSQFLEQQVLVDGSSRSKPKRIKQIQFAMQSGQEMQRSAVLQVSNKQLYDINTRQPVDYGCLDPRLGVSDKESVCRTCDKRLQDCTGHFGWIELAKPCFHIGFYKAIQSVFQSVCKSCGNLLLREPDKSKYCLQMQAKERDSIGKATLRKKILELCKKVRRCPVCTDYNGTVRRVQGAETLKLVHDKYKVKDFENSQEAGEFHDMKFAKAQECNSEFDSIMLYKPDVLCPETAYRLFSKIKDEDLPLLWADPVHSRPENMIMTHMLVPPVAIRPSVKMDTQGTNEDDLTSKVQEILDVNRELRVQMENGGKSRKIQDLWNSLQVRVAQFVNGELPGLSAGIRREIKPIRGLVQRLKGKQGRFRGNLSGKRVDFTGRTVISPDPNLSIDQVGVPMEMAKKLTYPEMVNMYNIKRLKKAILRGPESHPGANFIRKTVSLTAENDSQGRPNKHHQQQQQSPQQGQQQQQLLISLAFGSREMRKRRANELQIGDIVDRHLMDGDIVLFNRQPSLHKMSIMSHRAKILEGRTLRFNECVCAPYNADFDGDEMNLHVPQNEEARSEAIELMGVVNNLITPRNGEPLITATQDFITSAFLMTQRDVFLTRDEFCQMIATIGDGKEHLEIPPPAIIKPKRLWTGKQIWNLLLRPNSNSKWPLVNLETKERSFSGNAEDGFCMCPNEGYVIFRNSELLSGTLGKGVLGGSKTGLIYVLIRDYSFKHAASMMNRMTKVCTRWLTNNGFTIGIEDVMPDEDLLRGKQSEIEKGYAQCDKFIQEFDKGTLQTRPGCNLEESLESELSGVLSRVRDDAGKMCMQTLPKHNKPLIMATCGSKGSALNICQMMVCVGQQIVGGKRMPDGFVRRTLPHFQLDAKDPAAKGFVANSFYSGLTAPEFFFHTMGGREGLVDTAVKTAETGYMARRLMKALEDLSIRYDGSVRNSQNGVVQFTYGDDGLNPVFMEKGDRPVDWVRLENHIKPTHPCKDEPGLSPRALRRKIETCYSSWEMILKTSNVELGKLGKPVHKNQGLVFFVSRVHEAIENMAKRLETSCKRMGIPLSELDKYHDSLPLSSRQEVQEYWDKSLPKHGGQIKIWRHAATNKDCEEYMDCQWLTLNRVYRITETQLYELVASGVDRFLRAMTQPGEAVGAIGAQSLGEPGTQMTLKTFHFAGVASMNVTLGVPRIKEIINASKLISTPIITVKLDNESSEETARLVQGRLEATRLGDVATVVEERYTAKRCVIAIKLAKDQIEKLHLDITPETVRHAILETKSLKLKKKEHCVETDNRRFEIRVHVEPGHTVTQARASTTTPAITNSTNMNESLNNTIPTYFTVQSMKELLMDVIISGIPSVHRAVVNRDEKDNSKFHLLVEGLGLRKVLGIPGVLSKSTKTNHIMEMEEVLGIEAARSLVMEEVAYIFGRYGLSIDFRHLMLLADVMSYRGSILGITRFGIAKMKESVLMLASFEKTSDHLFDAAVHARKDTIDGVSECIIMGTPIPLGTGMFKLLSRWESQQLPKTFLQPQESTTIFP